jgi:hypothetical protein
VPALTRCAKALVQKKPDIKQRDATKHTTSPHSKRRGDIKKSFVVYSTSYKHNKKWPGVQPKSPAALIIAHMPNGKHPLFGGSSNQIHLGPEK